MASPSSALSLPLMCFYPNGDASLEGDIPCDSSGDSVPCCPQNWSCQDNGLCYLSGENFLGRYTCTDPNWGDGCPEICTHNNTASGNEAVLECNTNSYCCDTNRPDLTNPSQACCDATDSRFSLDNGKSMLPQGSSPSSTSPAVVVTLAPFSSSIPQLLTVNGPSLNTNSPSVSMVTPVVSQKASDLSIMISTTSESAAPATATGLSPAPQDDYGRKHLGAIIGPAVAVPLVLMAIALAMLFALRRRRGPRTANPTYPWGHGAEPKYEGEISPNSPYSSANKSELEGSSPDPSSSPITARPGYSRFESPKLQSTSLSTDPPSAGMRGSSRLSQISSVDQPQILDVLAGPVDPSNPQKGLSELPE